MELSLYTGLAIDCSCAPSGICRARDHFSWSSQCLLVAIEPALPAGTYKALELYVWSSACYIIHQHSYHIPPLAI
jgi:hypothetical protein